MNYINKFDGYTPEEWLKAANEDGWQRVDVLTKKHVYKFKCDNYELLIYFCDIDNMNFRDRKACENNYPAGEYGFQLKDNEMPLIKVFENLRQGTWDYIPVI